MSVQGFRKSLNSPIRVLFLFSSPTTWIVLLMLISPTLSAPASIWQSAPEYTENEMIRLEEGPQIYIPNAIREALLGGRVSEVESGDRAGSLSTNTDSETTSGEIDVRLFMLSITHNYN